MSAALWWAGAVTGAVIVDRSIREGFGEAIAGLADSALVTALLALVVLPLFVLAGRGSRRLPAGDAAWLLGSFLGAAVGLRVSGWLPDARFNWDGLITAAVIVALLMAAYPRATSRDLGVTRPTEPGWVLPTAAMAVAVLAYVLVLDPGGRSLGGEELLVNLTMPGVTEELLFRGLLLGVLDLRLGRPWRLWGATVGWGLVISTVLFAAVHVLRLDLSITPAGVATIVVGFGLGWIRERTGSIVPAVVTHNLWNTLGLAL